MKIIIVEDSEQDAKLMLKALERNGYSGVEDLFTSGESFIARAQAYSEEHSECYSKGVALVLLDLNLPGVSGIEVLKTLRETPCFRHTPVVVMTTETDREKVRACYEAGANGFTHKSVDFSDFLATVGQVLDYWVGVNTIVEQ